MNETKPMKLNCITFTEKAIIIFLWFAKIRTQPRKKINALFLPTVLDFEKKTVKVVFSLNGCVKAFNNLKHQLLSRKPYGYDRWL